MKGLENVKHNLNVGVVKSLMWENRINQREMARILGVSEVAVSRYLSRVRNPRTAVVKKMAEILGVDPEKILIIPEENHDPESAYRRVTQLIGVYAHDWSHTERMRIADKLLF